MPSIKAKIFSLILRNRHLLQLRLKKEIIDWNSHEAILQFRKQGEKTTKLLGRLPEGIEVSPVSIGQMYAEWIVPAQSTKEKAILYFHGGGYVSGTCQAHRAIVSKFVKESSIGALLFQYRLAPEHPFPAALEDAMAAYHYLLHQGVKPSHIAFMGDSAGGGLCLATLLALRDKGVPLPAAAVALSPWIDLKCSGESYRTKAKICLAPEGTAPAFAKHYAKDNDFGLPYISPLYGDLYGLPPLLLYAGENEIHRDDAIGFAEKATKAGTHVTLRIGEGLFHCYPACSPLFPEARQAMEEICTFMNTHLAHSSNLLL